MTKAKCGKGKTPAPKVRIGYVMTRGGRMTDFAFTRRTLVGIYAEAQGIVVLDDEQERRVEEYMRAQGVRIIPAKMTIEALP